MESFYCSLTPYRYGNKFDPKMVKEGIINLQKIFLYTQFAYHKSHGRVNKKLYITGSYNYRTVSRWAGVRGVTVGRQEVTLYLVGVARWAGVRWVTVGR